MELLLAVFTYICIAGYVKTYIVLPSIIWGIAQGRLVDLGISNNRSILIPVLVRVSLDRKQGGIVGLGKNLWPNVNIEERECFACPREQPS